MIKAFEKIMAILIPRIVNMVRYAKVTLVKGGKTQSAQVVTAGEEVLNDVKFIESYGFTFVPLEGSEAIVVNIMGDQNNPVIVKVGRRDLRPQDLKPGEVSVYDNSGNRINLRNGGNIEVIAPSAMTVKTNAASVEAETVSVKATTLTAEATTATVKANQAVVDSPSIDLGIGGSPVGRHADPVVDSMGAVIGFVQATSVSTRST